MDELVKLVSERTGLPPETAATAVQTVLGVLKERLPAPIASQIDAVIASGGKGGTDDPLGGLGKMFGR